MNQPTPVARRVANTILLVLLVGSGVSLSVLLSGNRTLAWQLCAGFGVITLIVLVIGGVLVGRSRS